MTGPLQLFAECCLPGCRLPSDVEGGPCPSCAALFDGTAGWTLQRGQGVAETAEQVAARKAGQCMAQTLALTAPSGATADAPAAASRRVVALERRQNQRCWLCEERRTCVKARDGWECDACTGIV